MWIRTFFLSFWFSKNAGIVLWMYRMELLLMKGAPFQPGLLYYKEMTWRSKQNKANQLSSMIIFSQKQNKPTKLTHPPTNKSSPSKCQYPRKGWVINIIAYSNTYARSIYICLRAQNVLSEVSFCCNITNDRKIQGLLYNSAYI